MALRVGAVRLPLAGIKWRGIDLIEHQARALQLAKEPRLLVEAPTGGGKTWTAAAPLLDALDEREGAIFVYPTNALADDQQTSLLDLVRRAGRPAARVEPDGGPEGDPDPHVMVWRVHAAALDESQEALGGRHRGDVLSRVFSRLPNRPLRLVTNPDTVYLLCLARYARSSQLWSRLQPCRTLVLDEFHLYRGPTLVRALVLIELSRLLFGVDRVRILSATLPGELRRLLEQGFGFRTIATVPSASGRTVQHEVDLEVQQVDADATDRMTERVLSLVETLRAEARAGDSVPLVVLRQSVLATIALEDELAKRGVRHEEIGVYRGLSAKKIRTMRGKTLVLGTSALEVGVDFRTSRLLFEARSAPSFVQRLGRVGRHERGHATFYTDARVASSLDRLGDQVARENLLGHMANVLESEDDRVGFALSPFGWTVAWAALEALRRQAASWGASDEFARRVDEVEKTLMAELGVDSRRVPVSRAVKERLVGAVGFRRGSGSVRVFDRREERRRGDAELAFYEVDLPLFYRRAEYRGEPGRVSCPVVVGYGKPRPLALTLRMRTAALNELHAPTAAQIELRVDGRATPWECLLRDSPHVVGLFPAALRPRLSWREDVFESSDGRIALLDDDALVGAYLWSMRRE